VLLKSGPTTHLVQGDWLAVGPMLPANSVHCVVTSPPYYALRSYLPKDHPDKQWELGSEATPEEYVANMVRVFREVRRVLRDDGVMFLNMGDSYSSGTTKPRKPGYGKHGYWNNPNITQRVNNPSSAGNLLNMPHRLAEALRQDGWVWRQTIVWAKRSPMPESVAGWKWVKHQIKVKAGWDREHPHPSHNMEASKRGISFSPGRQASIPRAEWEDCPGCPKCLPNGGLVLRRGSGRCTTAHEFVFVMTKTNRYFWDGEASKEPHTEGTIKRFGKNNRLHTEFAGKALDAEPGETRANNSFGRHCTQGLIGGRNLRTVWTLSSEPTKARHFATFPSELVCRCLAAGVSAGGCCPKCGAPWAPVVESERVATRPGIDTKCDMKSWEKSPGGVLPGRDDQNVIGNRDPQRHCTTTQILSYRPTCICGCRESVPCTVLDPFAGIGTTLQTARQLGLNSIGVELNPVYCEIARESIQKPPRWWLRQQKAKPKKRAAIKPKKSAANQRDLFSCSPCDTLVSSRAAESATSPPRLPGSPPSPSANRIRSASMFLDASGLTSESSVMCEKSRPPPSQTSTSCLSTSLAAGSPARTSRRRVKVKESREPVVACGLRCSALFPQYDPLGYLLKMYLLSEAEGLTKCSLAWKRKATPAGRAWLVLGRSGRPTEGTGCGSWPTAQASDANGGKGMRLEASETGAMPDGSKATISLRDATLRHWPTVHGNQGTNGPSGTELGSAVGTDWSTPRAEEKSQHNSADNGMALSAQVTDWQTPSAQQCEKRRQVGQTERTELLLLGQVRQWPTPNIPNRGPELDKNHRPNSGGIDLQSTVLAGEVAGLPDPASPSTIGKPRGSLNAEWVAQLMGFPPEYTTALTKACCEYWATHGSTRLRRSSSDG